MSGSSSATPANLKIIPWKDLKIEKLIGKGSYGQVSKGRRNGHDVAIKEVDPFAADGFEKEAALIAQCQDRRIVRLWGVCQEPDHFALVMEYVHSGTRLYGANPWTYTRC